MNYRMELSKIVRALDLDVLTNKKSLSSKVTGGYVCDLLSDVLANSNKGNIWITLQTHLNIVPVALMKEISAVIIVNGKEPDVKTLKKAEEEKLPLLSTKLGAFQVVGELYKLGIN